MAEPWKKRANGAPSLPAEAPPGTVVVTRSVDASAEAVWLALTDPALVCRWFGILIPGLAPGTEARFDFGDGDFFTVENVRLDKPYRLQYDWRFLGIGPLDTVAWHIDPQAHGCRVIVTDSEPGRTPEAARELRDGWLDFTERLQSFLASGAPTRYDWRRTFDASIELPGTVQDAADVIFAPGRYARWLPLDGFALEEGLCFYVEDGHVPTAFAIEDVRWETPTHVHFQLSHPDWLHPTRCTLALAATPRAPLLTIRHLGWEAVSRSVDAQRQQRKRFSAFWIECLQRARQLLAQEHVSTP